MENHALLIAGGAVLHRLSPIRIVNASIVLVATTTTTTLPIVQNMGKQIEKQQH
jgi:hypothetical protein